MKKMALKDSIITKRSTIVPVEVGSPKIMDKPAEIVEEVKPEVVQVFKTPNESLR